EPIIVLQRHHRPPQAKRTTSTMTNTEDQPSGMDDLATKVDKLNKDRDKPSVEARIDIPTYDGTIDAEKLDSWIDQLETYFKLANCARLHHIILTSFSDLGISIDTEYVLTKYVVGLPRQVQNEIRLYSTSNILDASSIAMAIEQKNKTNDKKFGERSKGEECNITWHMKEKCWKAHHELFPEKWVKDDQTKHILTTTFVDDTIEIRSIEETDKRLSLMVVKRTYFQLLSYES
nr:hypothetical protein [Tanacetum cinerariifolium]